MTHDSFYPNREHRKECSPKTGLRTSIYGSGLTRCVPDALLQFRDMGMGEYLKQQGYSQGFINNYVVPMCAAVWSVPKAQVGDDNQNAMPTKMQCLHLSFASLMRHDIL